MHAPGHRAHRLRYRDFPAGFKRAWATYVQIAARFVVMAGFLAMFATGSARAANEPVRIVALGDSLTAGYNLPAQDGFVRALETALAKNGHAVEISDAGVSGDTASGGLSRLDWAVPDGTDAVIVELGANDALRGVDPAVTREALSEIIARLIDRNIEILLAGMLAPPNMGPEYTEAFNAIYPDLAETGDVVFYSFFLDGVAGQPGLNLSDGMHPNAKGVDVIVERILPAVEKLIAKVKAAGPATN